MDKVPESKANAQKLRLTKIRNLPELQRDGPFKAILLYIKIGKIIQVAQFCRDGPSKAVPCHIKVCQAIKVTKHSVYGLN